MSQWEIGASEAAAPLGLSPYDSPLTWWLKKTGRQPRDPENRAMMWGQRLEPVILDDFEARHDLRLIRCTCAANTRNGKHLDGCALPPRYHPQHRWMRFTPDGLIVRNNCSSSFIERFEVDADETITVDAKSAAMTADVPRFVLEKSWGAAGSDEVPAHYAVQLQQQMIGVGATRPGFCRRGIITALIAGRDACDFHIPAEPKFQAFLVEKLTDIVNVNLEFDIPFEERDAVDWEAARTALYMRQPKPGKPKRDADADEAAMLVEYYERKQQEKANEARLVELRGRLMKSVADGYEIESATHSAKFSEGAAGESGWSGRALRVTEKKAKKA